MSTSKEPDEGKSPVKAKRSEKKNGASLDVEDIKELLSLLSDNDVREFKLERGDERLWLRRGDERPQQTTIMSPVGPAHSYPVVPQPLVAAGAHGAEEVRPATRAPQPAVAPAPTVGSPAPVAAPAPTGKEITSPMVGTFYGRPSPDADPFVQVGDTVKEGQVLCIVEAMKIMNEIQADSSGRISEICLEDGQMAEYGEVLFRIESA